MEKYIVSGKKSRVWDAKDKADASITANLGKGEPRTVGQYVWLEDDEAGRLIAAGAVCHPDDFDTDDAGVAVAALHEVKAERDAMAAKLAELGEGDEKPKRRGRPKKEDDAS